MAEHRESLTGRDPDPDLSQAKLDLHESREQFEATSEVLVALGRSSSNNDAVLDTLVRSVCRLCRGDAAMLYLADRDEYRLARSVGLSTEFVEYVNRHPLAADRESLVGHVGLDRRIQQIVDVLADSGYGRFDAQRIAGYRTIMGAPMLVDDVVVGVLSVWRTQVDPFEERVATLLTTFAAQAAVATRNVHLVRALEARGVELSRKVEQLEALRQVGEAVSSSLDLEEVLAAIVTQAVHLSEADGGSLLEFDDDDQEFRVRTAYGTARISWTDFAARRSSCTGPWSAGPRWRVARCRRRISSWPPSIRTCSAAGRRLAVGPRRADAA